MYQLNKLRKDIRKMNLEEVFKIHQDLINLEHLLADEYCRRQEWPGEAKLWSWHNGQQHPRKVASRKMSKML